MRVHLTIVLVKNFWERFKLDVSSSPISNVDIKLGDKSVISKSCVVVELLVKLNKVFVDLNSE